MHTNAPQIFHYKIIKTLKKNTKIFECFSLTLHLTCWAQGTLLELQLVWKFKNKKIL